MSFGKVMAVMDASRCLVGIWWHPMVGAAVEDARMAVRGAGGLTEGQYARLGRWAARWGRIDERLAELYSSPACINNDVVQHAIFVILEGGSVEPWQYGCLSNLWIEKYGYRPQIEMAPRGRQ